MSPIRLLLPLALLTGTLLAGCGGDPGTGKAGDGPPAVSDGVPSPDLSAVERGVRLAVVTAQRRVREAPESAAAWGALGQVFDAHEMDPEAEAAYRRARELDGEDPRWTYLLGRVVSLRGTDPEKARALLAEALELEPDYAPGHLRLADELARHDRHEEAAAAYRQALQRDDSLAKAHLGLGQVLAAQGKPGEAAAALERATRLDPRDGAAWGALARVRLRAGDEAGAEEAATRARAVVPVDGYPDPRLREVTARAASSAAVLERALARLDGGDAAGAVKDLNRVAGEMEADPYFHRTLGRGYLDLGRPDAARPALERALELSPDLVDVRLWLAAVWLEAGDPAAADRTLAEARERLDAPGATVEGDRRDLERLYHGHRGRVRLAQGRNAEGLASLREAARFGELEPVFESAWGQALAQAGRLGEAVTHFERAVEGNPRSAQARFQLGLAYEGLGRNAEAVAEYRKSMEIEPNPLAAGRLRGLTRSP